MKVKLKAKISYFLNNMIKRNKLTEHYDFYPNHIAVIEKPVTPYSRYIATIISLSTLAFILWSYLGKLDVLTPTTGKLIVSGYSQEIQIYEHSRLEAIHIQEGQLVKQGEPLLSLDILGVEEEIKGIKNKIDTLLLLKIRYQALSQKLAPELLDEFNQFNHETKASTLLSYQKEKDEFDASVNNINMDIEINNKNKSLIQHDLRSLHSLQENIESRFNIKKSLYDKHIISKMEFLENKKELLEIARLIKTKTSEFAVLMSQGKQLNKNLEKLEKQKFLEWHDKYQQYDSEITILTQNLNHAEKRQQLKIVRSPVTGTVQQLSVHTLGAVLQPSQTVMVIVPDNQHNIAQVNILNKDIGFIYSGQKAIIKLDAFPYTRYGTIEGKIINVAKDSSAHEQLGLVYSALIELDKQSMGHEENQYPLATGMSLVADIVIEKRRVIDYLLSPIEVYRHEALREK